jgi:hypothetical protein
VTILALLVTLIAIFAFQAENITSRALHVALIAVPILLQVYFNSGLTYGLMRLFSQLAQDCPLKVGKIIWVAGHSGPETAEDSRTHFGIYAPGVTQLFPDGAIINLHPWEYNEVPSHLRLRCARRAIVFA